MLEVFAIKLVEEEDYIKFRNDLLSILPEPLLVKIERFKRIDDEQRSLLGEVLCRKIISKRTNIKIKDLNIIKSENGKPELQNVSDFHFNISHSGKWVVLAVANEVVGIDVEKIKKPVYRIAERYFSKEELKNLNALNEPAKQAYFFDLWTLKESYLKMLGKGLTKSLGSFTISGSNAEFNLIENKKLNEGVYLKQYNLDPSYKFSVCTNDDHVSSSIQQISMEQLINYNSHAS